MLTHSAAAGEAIRIATSMEQATRVITEPSRNSNVLVQANRHAAASTMPALRAPTGGAILQAIAWKVRNPQTNCFKRTTSDGAVGCGIRRIHDHSRPPDNRQSPQVVGGAEDALG